MITRKNKFDYEVRSSYNLTVMASDQGTSNSLVSYVTINVTVLDTNDNRPKFHKKIYRFNITENAPSSIIGLLEVNMR